MGPRCRERTVAVGTEIALRPPHRSRRALSTHRAPTLDGDEEPLFGPRVQDAWEWQVPIIGPELATYGVVQPMARQMGLQTLGTLHQRIGDTLTLANTGGEGAGLARSDWARFFGQGIDNRYQLLPIRALVAGLAASRVASMCGAAASCLAIAMRPVSMWRLPTRCVAYVRGGSNRVGRAISACRLHPRLRTYRCEAAKRRFGPIGDIGALP